jgi:hypothetical protein
VLGGVREPAREPRVRVAEEVEEHRALTHALGDDIADERLGRLAGEHAAQDQEQLRERLPPTERTVRREATLEAGDVVGMEHPQGAEERRQLGAHLAVGVEPARDALLELGEAVRLERGA